MSLKLIRSAVLATTTNKDVLIAQEVRDVMKSLNLKESHPSLEITKSDYDRWMSVIHDTAQQSGTSITNKTILADIAMSVLDNDPKIESQPGDKETLKSQIVNTMWNAHKATLGHVGVQAHVKKAREEEEQSSFSRDFRASQGVEDEQKSSSLVRAVMAPADKNPYAVGSLRHSLWKQMNGSTEEEEFQPEEEMPPEDSEDGGEFQDEVPSDDVPPDESQVDPELDDEQGDAPIGGADEVDPEQELDPEDVLADISTEELEAELARRTGDDESDDPELDVEDEPPMDDEPVEDEPVEEPAPEEAPVDDKKPAAESAEGVAKRITFDDEEEIKSFFRHALTRPADEIRNAQKEIEKEGQEAWRNVNLPKNPHPPKSQAHKAWNKGLTSIAKAALGIKDPKPVVTSKQRKR